MQYVAKIFILLLCSNLIYAQDCDMSKIPSTPTKRFVINSGTDIGTVTDSQTGLMWKRCLEGQYNVDCQGYIFTMPWHTALSNAKQSTFGGYTDWRLPTVQELETIVEQNCKNPAINQEVFPNTNNSFVWSSSQRITRKYYFAWGIDFSDGDSYLDFQVADNGVRLVRSIRFFA